MEAPQAGGGESVTSPRILSVTVKIPVLRVGLALHGPNGMVQGGIGGSKGLIFPAAQEEVHLPKAGSRLEFLGRF